MSIYYETKSDDEKQIIDDIMSILNLKYDNIMTYRIELIDFKSDSFENKMNISIHENNREKYLFLYNRDVNSYKIYQIKPNVSLIESNENITKIVTHYIGQIYELIIIENHPNNYILK